MLSATETLASLRRQIAVAQEEDAAAAKRNAALRLALQRNMEAVKLNDGAREGARQSEAERSEHAKEVARMDTLRAEIAEVSERRKQVRDAAHTSPLPPPARARR
jgi:hypothetical protein|tara:strand:+ start:92 stop:406 length:315 start_codon:yes stop_codon:yes gene_type:complete